MEEAITAATERDSTLNFTHVGIFLTNNAADSVLEATTAAYESFRWRIF